MKAKEAIVRTTKKQGGNNEKIPGETRQRLKQPSWSKNKYYLTISLKPRK